MPTGGGFHSFLGRFRPAFLATVGIFLLCCAAWASGITIPAGSALNVADGQLNCELDAPCTITNDGVIYTTTGVIRLNGDWITGAAGYYDSGAGTVAFSAAAGTQTITPGTDARDAFFHLSHVGAGTVAIAANPLNINGTFSNQAGTFNAAGMTMNLAGNWDNDATFVHNNNTVNLVGADQSIYGDSTFYNLDKHLTAAPARTLTLEAGRQQTVNRSLVLQGVDAGARLNIVSSNPGSGAVPDAANSAKLQLTFGGIQDIANVAVSDNDARGGVLLVAREASQDNGRNQNWSFGSITIKWDGSDDTNWNNPFNWNLGIVPTVLDAVVIRSVDEDNGDAPIPRQPLLATDTAVAAVEIRSGASINLNGHDMAVTAGVTQSGTIILNGTESFTAASLTDTGAFKFVGDPDSAETIALTGSFVINGSVLLAYNGLIVEEENTSSGRDEFTLGENLSVAEDALFTAGSVALAQGKALTVAGALTVDGGEVDASPANIATRDFEISDGAFSAPESGQTFTVTGNFTRTGGAFTPNDGSVVFSGTDAAAPSSQAITGSVGFYDLTKQVPPGATQTHTLVFGSGDTVLVSHVLTLTGLDAAHQLNIASTVADSAGRLNLLTGAAQDIQHVSVRDNDASGGLLLVGRGQSQGVSNYTNWAFGPVTITWTGSVSTAWAVPFNWDLGMVPIAEDTVRIVDRPNQPVLSSAVSVGSLDIQDTTASLTLNGNDLTVASTTTPPGVLSNNGSLVLNGDENIDVPLPYIPSSGTFVYRGDGAGTAFNITGAGMPNGRPGAFFNLSIQDPPAGTPSVFTVDQDLDIYGSLSMGGGVTLAAGSSSLDIDQDFIMAGGTFTAPGSAESFRVAGDFTHTSGTFTANGGTLTLDGTSDVAASEQAVSGNTTFYSLSKAVPPGAVQVHRLIFDSVSTQTVTRNLALRGIVGNLLRLDATSADPDAVVRSAAVRLQAGGLQQISYMDVEDSDASAGITLVARDSDDHADAAYNNTNWIFGIPTITWTGTVSSDWDDPSNWNLGLVPIDGDDVVIAASGNWPHLAADVSLRDLTLEADAVLYADGNGLTVARNFSNDGNIVLQGTESVAIVSPDTDSGTFTYTGDDTGSPITLDVFDPGQSPLTYYNLVIADTATVDTWRTSVDLVVNGALTISGGTLDLSTGARTLTVTGTTTLTGGTLDAQYGTLALGSLALDGGTLSAPGAGRSFVLLGDWARTAGVFTPNDGAVTLNGAAQATISGSTSFYDLAVMAPAGGKTVLFEAGSSQSLSHTLTLEGAASNKLVLRSTVDGEKWQIAAPLMQTVNNLDVKDSTAVIGGGRPYILAFNSTDQQDAGVSTNTGWVFVSLDILAPADAVTTGRVPVIIGRGVPEEAITLKDGTGAVVATAVADANGNYRILLGEDAASQGTVTKTLLDVSAAANDRSLTPYYGAYPGNTSDFTVVETPTSAQVPVIDAPLDNELLIDTTPTITGRAAPGQMVYVVAYNGAGTMPLTIPPEAYAGTGSSDGSGNFSFDLTRALPRGFNEVSVMVAGVSSAVVTYVIHDIKGVVFDSGSSHEIEQARVTLFKSDGTMPVPGVDIDPTISNPATTGPDGRYSFLTRSGFFRIVVEVAGYVYPSTLADGEMPAGRSVILGSRGDVFEMTGSVRTIDQPVDPTPYLFKIEKSANKAEAKVGDIVTYTVAMESLLDSNTVAAPKLVDVIPPGFKFLGGRAQLDGAPLADPSGGRPLSFEVGDFVPRQKKTLRYQLVIGSGVVPGGYENTAAMKYANGARISNVAHEVVKVVLDPLFDAGTVFGKVFYDLNENGRQDDPDYVDEDRQQVVEGPVGHVRLVMEDGTVVTADKNGQFHIPALLPGRHLLRIDERSLPQGAYLTTDKVQVLDVTPGSIIKMNFGVNMDNAHIVGPDAEFFQKDFLIEQEPSQPKPRLNVNVFNENILFHNDAVIEQIEFRMFMNYAPFISSWQLDVVDADTHKVARSFKGGRFNILDPVYWDGRDTAGQYIRADRVYAYVLKVKDGSGHVDETRELPLSLKVVTDQEMTERQRQRTIQEKEQDLAARTLRYRRFLTALVAGDALKMQNIWVKGDTIILRSAAADVRQVRVLRNGELFIDVPVLERQGLTARELVDEVQKENIVPMEVILPDGDYELEVASASSLVPGADVPASEIVAAGDDRAGKIIEPIPVATRRYKKLLKVGEDYMMFVAMGDGKAGYNMNKGSVEPIRNDDRYMPGFYVDGKMAYYLKGKIKGKYVVTSSFDTERQRKEALRTFKDEEYYPVYGDESTVNYDATATEGPLYLAVEWDKSQAIWGNYAVAFNNTEFANYTRTLYGGKIDYKSVASTPYGEARTNVAVFHAQVRQRSAHNEFVGTGGSLYYMKNQDIVNGTEKLKVEVRDAVTGLVKSSVDMKEGVDYDMDYSTGRVLFWRPVAMAADNNRLISNGLLGGDPVYVVADYEYFVHDQLAEPTGGARVTQAIGKNVVAGGTYVVEAQADRNYQLKGEDVTVHLGKDATVWAEYAQTSSKGQNSFISTDGGITFDELGSSNDIQGRAYGIRQDARLFDRVGLKSYYKWIDAGYSTGASAAQQGKELAGMSMVFDLTPVTRLTASRDIQRLIDQGNLQTAMQVGAQETITTMAQVVHDARRLRLTYELQNTQVKDKSRDYESTTNTQAAAAAFQAEYVLNERTDLVFRHQRQILGAPGQSTTLGIKRQLTPKLAVSVEETVGTEGTATKAGVTANVTPKLALSTDYTLARARTGELLHTMTVAGKGNINDKTALQTAISITQLPSGLSQSSTVAVGASSKVGEDADIKAGVEATQASGTGITRQALALEGARRGKEGRETTTGVKIEDNMTGGKTTVITAGEKGMINPSMQMATERSFGFNAAGQDMADTYKVSKAIKDGRMVETSYARKQSAAAGSFSDANVFGLTGDINDRVALQGSLEKGKVQNVDGTVTDRVAVAVGAGYVQKGDEPGAAPIFQSSTKAEVRLDSGVVDKQQAVFYQSAEGRLNDQTTVRGKFGYSTTLNKATGKAEAGYKEIMLGAAYRPVAMDRLNVFGQYTYKENKGPDGQAVATDIEATKMHVVTAGAAIELNEKWELVEKLAMRIMQEKVTGFEFAKTHTWLLINRANYTLNQDWKIGAEYRMLAVKEARDRKAGFLAEAVHGLNDNMELGIGYNFTDFVDDLTNMDYTVQGPFIRMTGKLYDQSPQERARARARWLDHRIDLYARKMIKDELTRNDGVLVVELNKMYRQAQSANERGKYEDAREAYKHIILVTQMMYEEAAQFIRRHIAWEEGIYNAFQRAREYYDKAEFWKARKLWEKIVEEASRAVLE